MLQTVISEKKSRALQNNLAPVFIHSWRTLVANCSSSKLIVDRLFRSCVSRFSLLVRLIHERGSRLNHDPRYTGGGGGGWEWWRKLFRATLLSYHFFFFFFFSLFLCITPILTLPGSCTAFYQASRVNWFW